MKIIIKILLFVVLLLGSIKVNAQCANPTFNGALWPSYTTGFKVSYNPGSGNKDYRVKSGYSGCWNAPTLDGGSCWVLDSDPCAAAGTAPTVSTDNPSSVLNTTATTGGNASVQGSSAIVSKGIIWNTTGSVGGDPPTVDEATKTDEGGGTGTFTSNLTGLNEETKYFVRAYATNGEKTGYGAEKWFYTGKAPTMTTLTAIDIHCESFTSGAESITFGRNKRDYGGTDALGSLYSNATEFGVIFGPDEDDVNNSTPSSLIGDTRSEVHLADNPTVSLNQLERYVEATGLLVNTQYWYKAYTSNGLVTGYGTTKNFTTTTACPVYYSCPWAASQADRWSLNSDCSTSDGAGITNNSIAYHRHDWLTAEITDLDSDVSSEAGSRLMTALPYRLVLQNGSRVVTSTPTFVGGFQLEVQDNAQFSNNGSLLFHIDGNAGADGHIARLSNNGSILVRGSYDNRISLTGIGEYCKTGTFTNLNSVPADLNGDQGNPPSMPHTRYINGDCVGTSTLPIELIDFTISVKDGKVIYKWITGMELNNDYFQIETSSDGLLWDPIATVDGAGNSNNILHYSHIGDLSDYIKYVRLKQVDFDGEYSYSKIILLNEYKDNTVITSSRYFIMVRQEESYIVSIYQIDGALVYEEEHEGTVVISKGKFRPGIYVVKVGNKIIKMYVHGS